MTTNLVTIHEGEPVSKLRKIFDEGSIHHIPVVSGEKLVGIISSSDLLRVSFGELGNQDGRELDAMLDHTYKIIDIMNKNPVTVPAWSTVRDAARILAQGNFHSVPVVDEEKLVGIVTSTDLINYLLDI